MKAILTSARDLKDLAKKVQDVLSALTFQDNMESFEVTGLDIGAGSTVTIKNQLTFVPKKYIITSQSGNGLVTKEKKQVDDSDGNKQFTRDWNDKELYLKNNGSVSVKIDVTFMR
jgi:maltodextrin utilization protein YvdJ